MVMRQAWKFIVVGGISTVINYAIFFLSYHYGQINYLVASAIGYVTGLSLSYIFNASWTFRQQSTSHLIGNQIARLANIIAIGQTTITNFLGCKHYVFK